jgi:hypothetical protein
MTRGPNAAPASPPTSPSPSVAGWANRGLHTVHLPSGMVVKMRIPDLAFMLAHGEVPDHLRTAAMLEVLDDTADETPLALRKKEDGSPLVDEETIRHIYDLRQHLIVAAVVEPAVTEADLPSLPTEDKDMLQLIATRQRFTDARGVSLGVEPLSRWETFRGEHGCGPDCAACAKAVQELSTVDVDSL